MAYNIEPGKYIDRQMDRYMYCIMVFKQVTFALYERDGEIDRLYYYGLKRG